MYIYIYIHVLSYFLYLLKGKWNKRIKSSTSLQSFQTNVFHRRSDAENTSPAEGHPNTRIWSSNFIAFLPPLVSAERSASLKSERDSLRVDLQASPRCWPCPPSSRGSTPPCRGSPTSRRWTSTSGSASSSSSCRWSSTRRSTTSPPCRRGKRGSWGRE